MAVGTRVSETDRVCGFVDLTFALGWGQVNKDIRGIGASETKGRGDSIVKAWLRLVAGQAGPELPGELTRT